MNPPPAPLHLRGQGSLETLVLGVALLVMPAMLGGNNLSAQTHASQATKLQQQQKAAAPEAIAARPPAAPTPIWPINQPPNLARVSWDSRGLEIEASNSSLNQILQQVAADTGAKLEGLNQDQRVFGSYGPGPGSDVLLKLLDGSGYNVLMIGGHDTDAPLMIILSARSPASTQTVANNQNRSNPVDDEPPPPPPAESSSPQQNQNPFANGEPARDPMQFMQEILQRQQKIDQQQDQQNNTQQ